MPKKNNKNHEFEQNRRLGEIEKHIGTINEEMSDVKIEIEKVRTEMANMRNEFTGKIGEVIRKIAELKASKRETLYAILTPVLFALVSALAVYIITK